MGIATLRRKIEAIEQKTDDLGERIRFEKAVKDVEAWFTECQKKFNSPEAERIRRTQYQEMLARGEKFKIQCYQKWEEEL